MTTLSGLIWYIEDNKDGKAYYMFNKQQRLYKDLINNYTPKVDIHNNHYKSYGVLGMQILRELDYLLSIGQIQLQGYNTDALYKIIFIAIGVDGGDIHITITKYEQLINLYKLLSGTSDTSNNSQIMYKTFAIWNTLVNTDKKKLIKWKPYGAGSNDKFISEYEDEYIYIPTQNKPCLIQCIDKYLSMNQV